jgi:opacity protein-like surface antigen
VKRGFCTMKRAMTIIAVTAGALAASVPARADETSTAERIMNAVYSDFGFSAKAADEPQKRDGFFVGIHQGLGAESGLSPIAAGLSIPLDMGAPADSITANGYYVFTTDWSLGSYVGGGFGKFNLTEDPLSDSVMPAGNFAYQGVAGLTWSFTPSMALGLEYRYTEAVDATFLQQSTIPQEEENQSVTLRFDFLLN